MNISRKSTELGKYFILCEGILAAESESCQNTGEREQLEQLDDKYVKLFHLRV